MQVHSRFSHCSLVVVVVGEHYFLLPRRPVFRICRFAVLQVSDCRISLPEWNRRILAWLANGTVYLVPKMQWYWTLVDDASKRRHTVTTWSWLRYPSHQPGVHLRQPDRVTQMRRLASNDWASLPATTPTCVRV